MLNRLKRDPKKCDKANQTTPDEKYFFSKERKQIAKLPVFGGNKDESFKKFIHHIEMIDAHDERKMEILVMRLHGSATNEFIETMTQNASTTFQEMIKELQKAFPETQSISLQTLRRRKQLPNEPLELFADSIRSLVNKFFTNAQGYNEQARNHQMIKFFMSNVQQPLKRCLQREKKKFNYLNDILLKAQQLQNQEHKQQMPMITSQLSQLNLHEKHVKDTDNKEMQPRQQTTNDPMASSSTLNSRQNKAHQQQQKAKRGLSNQGSKRWSFYPS